MATENTEILQMHDLKPAPGAKKDRIRVGRGEGSKGKTSGRGDKGTKKRYQVRPGFEGGQLPLYMRLWYETTEEKDLPLDINEWPPVAGTEGAAEKDVGAEALTPSKNS